MIYLFLSIITSALIFVIFKGFQRYQINNFQAIIVNYLVASSLGWVVSSKTLNEVHYQNWLHLSIGIAVLFITLFVLMAKVSQEDGVSVASVSVKMSVVIPVLLGVLIFKDTLTIRLLIGILASLVAIVLITKKESRIEFKHIKWPLVLFFGNGILDAILKFTQQSAVKENEISVFTASSFGLAALIGFVAYPFIKGNSKIERKNILAGILLGVPNFGTIYFLMMALEKTKMTTSVFFPINNIGIVMVSALMAMLIFKEKLNTANSIGLALGLFSIILISQ